MKPELAFSERKVVLAFALILALAALSPRSQAQTFKVVHNFTNGSDGGYPLSGLTMDSKGNFYGTTNSGGTYGHGGIFRMNSSGGIIPLYNFTGGKDGSAPVGGLILDAANALYGTTSGGGTYSNGAIFKVMGKTEVVLYSFAGGKDGSNPEAGLTFDAAGNLYGTTSAGGASGNGTVFRLNAPATKGARWTKTILYSFGTGTDGAVPVAGVSLDAGGNVYGTTSLGGDAGNGTIFELTNGAAWTETILHYFQNADDGATPYAGLIADAAGNFYGAATQGGTGGGGTIFELTPSGTNWTFNVLYGLPGWGISGSFRDLMFDTSGNLYGTTHCDGDYTAGTVWELVPSAGAWTYNQLYDFTGNADGLYSFSNLVSSQGELYGTTKQGGKYGYGVVFEVIP
jgi:uncharacterized repeat protein (TIGR03803 family)